MAAHTQDPIPLVNALADVYSSKDAVLQQGQRWDKLAQTFQQHFNHKPSFIARAPGRVNVIGEHVDHMGFGVLPAAIELDILMAVRVVHDESDAAKGDKISFHLRNTTPRFEPASFESPLSDPQSVELLHSGETRWANYFKVAWKGLHPHLPKHVLTGEKAPPTRIEVLVDGTIPPESSLSSSAAMTVCSSIVILESLGARQHISRREMAEVAIESERYVGVASGGMDQSASIFGHPNSVLHITFHPGLAISRVQMPSCTSPEFTFLVANSLVVSDKKVNGPVQYNLRVVELLIAARVFAAKNGLPLDDSTKTWRKLMAVYFEHSPLASKGQDAELDSVRDQLGDEAAQIWLMSKLVSTQLPEGLITREKAEELTGYRGAAFDQEFLSQFEIRAPNGFNLFNRTRHVFAESLRVHQFRALCLSTQGGSASPDLYGKLGELMNDSHASLARDYENTCPELEKIVSLCRQHGSIGSRLTGAGWGGSTVHLVPKDKVLEITEALRRDFYAERWPDVKGDKLQGATLESQPAGGACVLHLES